MSIVRVGTGIFYSRPAADGEHNSMIAIRKDFEASGGKFIEHSGWTEIFPGACLPVLCPANILNATGVGSAKS